MASFLRPLSASSLRPKVATQRQCNEHRRCGTVHRAPRGHRLVRRAHCQGRSVLHPEYGYTYDGHERVRTRDVTKRQWEQLGSSLKRSAGGPPPVVKVRVLGVVGDRHFQEPLPPGDGPWQTVALAVGVCVFWNGIVAVFVNHLYVRPWRDARRSRGETAWASE